MTTLGIFALAFTSGLISPVNPCGFALLPAYLAYHVGTDRDHHVSGAVRVGRGLRIGLALAVGFAGTLSLAGLTVALGARALLVAAPWLSLGVGGVLALIGLIMLTGRSVPLRLPRALRRTGGPSAATSTPRMIAFGVGYGIASLTCAFSVLLAVITQALAAGSVLNLLGVLAVYAAGAATLLLLLSLGAALVGTSLTRATRIMARFGSRIAGGVLLVTGAYLIIYYCPAATQGTNTNNGLTRFVANAGAHAQMWLQTLQPLVVFTALAAVTTALVVVLHARRHRALRAEATGHRAQHEQDATTRTNAE